MKKYMYLLSLVLVSIACSKDDSATYGTSETLPNSDSTVVLETFNPITSLPQESFDNSSKGLYHGVIVTTDMSIHGKIWINILNNGAYSATVLTDNLKELSFIGESASQNDFIVQFAGDHGSFLFDVSNFNTPVAMDVQINGVDGHILTVKDKSNQRATSTLGTYVDDNDASFAGSWDLLTDGSTTGTAFGYPALTQVCILSPNGAMFIVDQFTSFSYPCFDINGDSMMDANDITLPVFHAAGGPEGDINEFWAQDQTATLAGLQLTYSLGQSSTLSQNGFGNTMFINNDLASPPTAGCFVIPGKKGIWTWNGREGSVFFNDPFDQ